MNSSDLGTVGAGVSPDACDHLAAPCDRWHHGSYVSTLRPSGLAPGTQIWLVDPENPGPFGELSLLSESERERAQRYLREVNRREYIAAHGLLRTQLGRVLGIAPQTVRFVTGPHGRPELAGITDISFSLSHTTGLVGCAIARGAVVGFDLEPLRRIDALAMAPGILDETERRDTAARSGDARCRRFLAYWTLKEAVLKVRGTGLTLPADGAVIRWLADGSPVVAALPDGARPACHVSRLWGLSRQG